MCRPVLIAVVAMLTGLAGICLPSDPGRAARITDGFLSAPSRYEILVFEKPGCRYCEVFRADVATRYRELPQAAKMPMRFVDIEKADIGVLRLKSSLSLVPTAVVMRDGAEIDRIQGLTSTRNFFLLLQHIAGPLE